MDVAAIGVGRDFRRAIDESVASCGVLLALIGPAWLDERNENGERRLDDPGDFVRVETASALKRDIPVIPVLVRGAKMPRRDQLPNELKDLAYRNCVELTHMRWKSDVKVLVGGLRPLLADTAEIVAASGGNSTASDPKAAEARFHLPAITQPPNSAEAGSNAVESEVDAACGGSLDAETIKRITRELAQYVGPIAEILVKRAAKTCHTIADLRRTLAEEIDTKADRIRFVEACRER
jgi:hypothetical protein